ncbi:MAG: N-acetylmuramoyl-L-alanine amidase [bacterium]|nr:N-acetylmuramoyl-L-alanine amidase [bacterium]
MSMVTSVPVSMEAAPARGKRLKIIDYRKHLNKKFKKKSRVSSRFIIIHTSEAGLTSTLRTLSRGKSVGKYRTVGGHSHYTIARDGRVYRVLHHRYRADHAGLSMWKGIQDLSSHSLGIELVGYHYGTITDRQYGSLSRLLKTLKRTYRLKDKSILTHSQVSYGRPNLWFKRRHRGRKRCALNFERNKAGLKRGWTYDPDVRARRLQRDFHIYTMFYKGASRKAKTGGGISLSPSKSVQTKTRPPASQTSQGESPTTNGTTAPVEPKNGGIAVGESLMPERPGISNVISKQNTAWNIAGEEYDDSTTLYVLPGNKQVRGDKLGKRVGWDRLPTGTKVLLNQPMDVETKQGPVFLLSKEYTAWSVAQAGYREPTTIYFLPSGGITSGSRMVDWDAIPSGTRMIVGYNGPIKIQAVRGKTPWGIAGRAYNHRETIYFIPGNGPVTGDKVKDFNDLPRGSQLFLKITNNK